jgi:predicted NBD/HSP70 family sugar kinase
VGVLAFEVVVDSLAVAVVGLGGNVLSRQRLTRPRSRTSVSDTVTDLAALANQCLNLAPSVEIVGSGAAVAGLVRRDSGTVLHAPNFIDWNDVPLRNLLIERCELGCSVIVRNEGELAALAEWRRGAGRGCSNLVFLNGEVGLGGGLICGGVAVKGANGLAGEVGHMPVNPNGQFCGCGARGCWETEVGERALLRRAGRDVDGGDAAITSLLAAAQSGEPRATAAYAETGRWLGIGIAGLAQLLNPALVVLGGNFSPAYALLVDGLKNELAQRPFPPIENLQLAVSQIGEDAPLLGAAEVAFERVLADPIGATTHS